MATTISIAVRARITWARGLKHYFFAPSRLLGQGGDGAGQSGNQGFYLPPVLSMLRTLVGLEILLDFKTVSDPRAAIGLEANLHKKSQR